MSAIEAKRIAVLNLNETRRDPRVLRISGTLQALHCEVRVFEMQSGQALPHEVVRNLQVVRCSAPADYSIAAMAEIRKECGAAADVIESCHPAVMNSDGKAKDSRMYTDQFKEEMNRVRCFVTGRGLPRRRLVHQEILAIRSILLINLSIYRSALEFRPEVVIANDLDTLLAAYMLHVNLGTQIIFDAHEVYPEQLSVEMRSEFWRAFYTKLEEKLAKFAAGIMTVCGSIASYMEKQYHVSGVTTILNVPMLKHLPDPRVLERKHQPVKLLYHGAYFQHRGLEQIIAASKSLENAVVELRGVGSHGTELRDLAEKLAVGEKVVFRDPVPVDDLIRLASDCDVGLNPFVNVCKNTEFALPNKFFEYMMAGLAVVSSNLQEMRSLTEALRIGVLLDELSARSIADKINTFVANPDQLQTCRTNAYHAARTRYNWEAEEHNLVEFLNRSLC
jgi:glycogen synthase